MLTTVAAASPHEEAGRRAMLQRLADGLAVIARPYRYEWTCCWADYTLMEHGRPVKWGWRFCNGNPPGALAARPCDHWHHQAEIFLA